MAVFGVVSWTEMALEDLDWPRGFRGRRAVVIMKTGDTYGQT